MPRREKAIFEVSAEDRASRIIRKVREEFKALDQGANAATGAFGTVSKATKSLEKDFVRLGGVIAAAFSIRAITGFAQAAVREAAAFETGLTAVAKTTGATSEQLKELTRGVEDLERKIPTSSENLLGMASAAGQLGVKGTNNILKFTETLARLELASDVTGEQGARDLARLLNITGSNTDDIDNLGAAIVGLGNSAAATEAEIVHMATFVGQSVGQFGVSADEVVGLSTAMKELGLRAELSGSAVGRAFRAIQVITQEGGERAQALSDVMGQSAEEIAEAFREDAASAFVDFLEGLSQTGDDTTNVLTQLKLAGDENLRVFPTLARNVDLVRQRLAQSSGLWRENRALIEESTRAADTYASKLQLFQNRQKQFNRSLGELIIPDLSAGLAKASEAIDLYFQDWADAAKGVGLGIAAFFENISREQIRNALSAFDAIRAAAIATFNVIGSHIQSALGTAFTGVITQAETAFNAILANFEKINTILPGRFEVDLPTLSFPRPDIPQTKSFSDEFFGAFAKLDEQTQRYFESLFGEVGFAESALQKLTQEQIKRRKALAADRLIQGEAQAASELKTSLDGAGDAASALASQTDAVTSATDGAKASVDNLAGALSKAGVDGVSSFSRIAQEAERLRGAADAIRSRFATPVESLQREFRSIDQATGAGGLSGQENQIYKSRALEEFREIELGMEGLQGTWQDTVGVLESSFSSFLRGGVDDFGEFVAGIIAEIAALQAERLLFGDNGVLSELFGGGGTKALTVDITPEIDPLPVQRVLEGFKRPISLPASYDAAAAADAVVSADLPSLEVPIDLDFQRGTEAIFDLVERGLSSQHAGELHKALDDAFKSGDYQFFETLKNKAAENLDYFDTLGQSAGVNFGEAFSVANAPPISKGLENAAMKARDILAGVRTNVEPRKPSAAVVPVTLPVEPGIDPGAFDLLGGQVEEISLNVFQAMEDAGTSAATRTAASFEDANQTILGSLADMAKGAVNVLSNLARRAASFLGDLFGGAGGGGGINLGSLLSFIPGFNGGGFTGYGPRTGGVDGFGGFPAILHPNEQVIDLSRGQMAASGGGMQIAQTLNIQPGVSQEMIPQILAAAKEGTMAAIRDEGLRGGRRARTLGF